MTTEQRQRTMFVGVDVHKDTHTAVGISPYGEKLFEITVGMTGTPNLGHIVSLIIN